MTTTIVKVEGHDIKVTNHDKVLFPEDGITKGELVEYYKNIAGRMLPEIRGRPLTLQRFPDGIDKEGFFQKSASDYYPEWMETAALEFKKGIQHQTVCNNEAAIVYLASQAVITIHEMLSRMDKLLYPDRMVFDLDPGENDFSLVVHAARHVKKTVEDLGFKAFVMTTGSKGLHVIMPLDRSADFDAVHEYARHLSIRMAKDDPERLSAEIVKEKRGNRLFLDYMRDTFGQTHVAPYSVRPKKGAPVAMPVTWEELDDIEPQSYNIRNVFERLEKKGDPWKDMDKYARGINPSSLQRI